MADPYNADAIDYEDGDEPSFGGEGYEPSKDFVVLLIDAHETMFNLCHLDEQPQPYFSAIVGLVNEFTKGKIISSSSDEVAIVFYGTKTTKNSSNFDNVYVFQDLDIPDAQRIRDISILTVDSFNATVGSADPVHADPASDLKFALWTASQMFTSRPSKANRKIMVFTNNDNPVATSSRPENSRDQILARCSELAGTGVSLSLFPLLELEGGFRKDVFWEAVLQQLRDPEEEWEEGDVGEKIQNMTEQVRRKLFRKRALAHLRWTVAPELDVGVQIYTLVQPLAKSPALSLRAQDHQLLRAETAYICNDTGAILRLETDITKFRYDVKTGDKSRFPSVVFLASERKQLKSILPPGLRLVGFKPLAALKPHHQVGPHSYFLRPSEKELKGSTPLFTALMMAMLNRGVFALCSFVRTKASEPRLVALLPQPDSPTDAPYWQQYTPSGFHLIPLPFADDIRTPEEDAALVAAALGEVATQEQVEAAEKMIKALALPDFQSGDQPNPALQRHYEVLEAIALEAPIPPLDEFEDETAPDVEGMERQHSVMQSFKDLVFGGDYEERQAAGGAKKGQKRARGAEEGGKISIRELAQQGKLESLTVVDLKEYLTVHKLKVTGKKADLVDRVKEHLGV